MLSDSIKIGSKTFASSIVNEARRRAYKTKDVWGTYETSLNELIKESIDDFNSQIIEEAKIFGELINGDKK